MLALAFEVIFEVFVVTWTTRATTGNYCTLQPIKKLI